MNELIHIAFGDSAAGSLKHFFKTTENKYKGKVFRLREEYNIGPIYELEAKKSIQKRIKWFENMLNIIGEKEYVNEIGTFFEDTYKDIDELPKNAKVVIWHGLNTSDQIGLRYLCSKLKNKDIYEINVSKIIQKDFLNQEYFIRSLGECNLEKIELIINSIEKINEDRKIYLAKEWNEIRKMHGNLRILKENKIVTVEETYYDKEILFNCTLNFKKAARVIGATMGKSDQVIGDSYIDYRVRKLIENKSIEYKGLLESMRDFEIKLK